VQRPCDVNDARNTMRDWNEVRTVNAKLKGISYECILSSRLQRRLVICVQTQETTKGEEDESY
jgi:hypothetical protein